MKRIAAIKSYNYDFNTESESTTISFTLLNDLLAPIEENKTSIVNYVAEIETEMDYSISYFFFRDKDDNTKAENDFFNQILHSDWCTFSAKRKLLRHIVSELELLDGEIWNEADKLLSRVMGYRNAFVHGKLVIRGEDIVLKYFSGSPVEKILNDDYFEKIEANLKRCHYLVQEFYQELQAPGTGMWKKQQ